MNTNKPAISPQQLLSLIEKQNFGVEYQPIIALSDNRVFAYEALSRFYDEQDNPIAPDLVYNALHHNPLSLFQVEFAQKKIQLQCAPENAQIFVNLDQDSYFAYGDEDKEENPFLTLFQSFTTNKLIVELIENSEINDARMSLKMIQLMAEHNIQTAIDDICSEHSMLSTKVLEHVDFMKFDRYVVLNKHNPEFLLLIKSLISYAKSAGKKTILEGVETEEDKSFASELGFDYVQGFLFKPQFIKFKKQKTPPTEVHWWE